MLPWQCPGLHPHTNSTVIERGSACSHSSCTLQTVSPVFSLTHTPFLCNCPSELAPANRRERDQSHGLQNSLFEYSMNAKEDVIEHFKTKPSFDICTNNSLHLCYWMHKTAWPESSLKCEYSGQTVHNNRIIPGIFYL
jgi:hypothetical protein